MVNKLTLLSSVSLGLLFFGMTGKAEADAPTQMVRAVAPNPAGLVAHYEFEGETNDSTGTNHGTLNGNPTYGAGVSGQAIKLDGNGDYVNCGNGSSFNLTNRLTVAAWIKVNTFDEKYQALITKGDNSWRLARASGSNNIEFACSGTATTRWTGWGEVPWAVLGTTSVNDGKWHHIAGVFDGSGLYLYIDGGLEAAKGAAKSIDISNSDMCIGANAQASGREWNGLIDDVRIYNYALSQAEIVSVMGKSEIYLELSLPATLYNIAKRYDGLKKSEEAKGVCQLILQRYSDSSSAAGAQLYLSKQNIMSLIKSKKYKNAQAEFDTLIADFNDHPDLAEALCAIARSYEWPRKFEKAKSIYERAARLNPDNPYVAEAQFNAPKFHIFSLIKSGKYTEAQADIDKFDTDFIDHLALPGVLYWFAIEFELAKRYDQAKSTYQEVIVRHPDGSHALKAELKIPKMDVLSLIKSGNDSAAETAVDSLIVDFRDHEDLPEEIFTTGEKYYNEALRHEKRNRDAEAKVYFGKTLTIWEKIITQLPQSKAHYSTHIHYFSGYCRSRLGEYEKAIEYYQKVVDVWPKYEYAWHAQLRIARCYEALVKSGHMSKAEAGPQIRQACEKLLANYPRSKGVNEARDFLKRWDLANDSQ